MKDKKIYIILIIICAISMSGCNNSLLFLNSKSSIGKKIVLSNKKISLDNLNKVDEVLKHIKGNNYYKEYKSLEEYEEKVITVKYGVNEENGESDYINFWDDANKKEIVVQNAVYLLLTVENLDKVKIILDRPFDEQFIINRNNLEEVYGIALEDYRMNEESLGELLRGDNIEKIWCLVNS